MSEREPIAQDLIEEEAQRWIARMASGEMSSEELASFRTWRQAALAHNRAFEEQRAVWRAVGSRPVVTHRAPPEQMSRRHGRRWLTRTAFRMPRRLAAPAIAAAIAALMLFGPDMIVTIRSDYRTGTGVESVALQDGSRVMLNAGSAIAISYDDDERRIDLLRGDAWFEVAHGDKRPFRVTTLDGATQDIGTAFEVQRDKNSAIVSVTQGAVEVSTFRAGSGTRLKASERARYGQGGGSVVRMAAVDPVNIASWRQGEILLEKVSAADAIAHIARYRSAPVYILGTADAARKVSGVFKISQTDEAIDAIAHMAHLTVYRIGGIVLLKPAS
ncbi:MAG: FecR domain-containing protein [Sphingobium sp.]